MEAADFVADSDEEEQELLEALASAEEQHTRQRLEAAAAAERLERSAPEPKRAVVAVVVTPEKPPTVQEQSKHGQAEGEEEAKAAEEQEQKEQTDEEREAEAEEKETVEELEQNEQTDEEQDEGDEEEDDEQEQEGAVLDVGTVVTVEARTWPGINKLGGSGRVVRVHRERADDGETENIFYDVRYVLGGFEKHVESTYVHSSKILEQHSDRKKVDREYYHDDYINEPYRRKQLETERRHEMAMARSERAAAHALHHRKRKRSQRAAHDEPVPRKPHDNEPSSGDARHNVSKIEEDAFIFSEDKKKISLEDSSRPPSDSEKSPGIQSPQLRQPRATQRRRHHILDSDDESSEGSANDDGKSVSPERVQLGNLHPSVSPPNDGAVSDNKENNSAHRQRQQKRRRRTRQRRYVGGYEHADNDLDDPDAVFIQPEGNPSDLPEDVLRKTGIKLANTKDGLMKQLQDVFAQQQKHMANFHDEQKVVNKKLKNLMDVALSDLEELYKKVLGLESFVTTTLVNAGEDVMNKIIEILHNKRGKTPSALEHLESKIDEWQRDLNECSPWARKAKEAVENAFARRDEDIPIQEAVRTAYSSDSGESNYSADDYGATEIANQSASMIDELDFSYDYEPERHDLVTNVRPHSKAKKLVPGASSKTAKQQHRKKFVTSTTLDDFFPRQGSGDKFRSNLRLIGKQTKITRSDPRWNWIKMARKKQQRAGGDTREHSGGLSLPQFSVGVGSRHQIHEPRPTRHDDSASVQIQRKHLRDKRFRSKESQQRSRETFVARPPPKTAWSTMQPVLPGGISFGDIAPTKRKATTDFFTSALRSSSPEVHVDWKTVFEVLADDTSSTTAGNDMVAISRQQQYTLATFGHPISGPFVPHHLVCEDDLDFETSEMFRRFVFRRCARLRQLMNDFRLEENNFMESLSSGGLGSTDENGFATAPEWISLVSLEERYHTAIATFATQVLQSLESASPSVVSNYLDIILDELAALVRQLPDCEALFGGCKAYFFFFEVASRDAATTPLMTAISRAYWYCLTLLTAARSTCYSIVGSNAAAIKEVDVVFFKKLPVNRVTLAVVLFLFDLYLYLPTSHRLGDAEISGSSLPALSLWLLVRDCTTNPGQDKSDSRVNKEKHFWALLQVVYQQHYFDELARCFVRNESSGGYLRDFTPKVFNGGGIEHRDEILESQLLALESTWDLLAVLTRVYADEENIELEAEISDARWAVVKDLLHPNKRSFLPFDLSIHPTESLVPDFVQRSNYYMQHVLSKIAAFSKWWRPSKDIIGIVVKQLCENDGSANPDEVVELPEILKQFAFRCRELGNSRPQLAAFAESSCGVNELDFTATLCKIIWIQLLKLEKRVHRGRFRQSVLSAIPPPETNTSSTSPSAIPKPSGSNWNWGAKSNPAATQQAAPQPTGSQQTPPIAKSRKERTSTAVLLTFAVVGICLECGNEQRFPSDRTSKDVRYMEREVDFYCKEILRWTSGRLHCEVIAAQALYTMGALLLERNSTEFPIIFRGLDDRLNASVRNLQANLPAIPPPKEITGARGSASQRDLEKRRRRLQSAAMSSLYQMRNLVRKMIEMPSSGVSVGQAYGPAVEKSLEHIFSFGMEACLNGVIQKTIPTAALKTAMEIFQLVLPRAQDKPTQCLALLETPPSDFDFFDADLAHFDLERALVGYQSAPPPAWTSKDCRTKVIELITNKLRVVVQQLVLNYPQSDAPAFDELYAIDLLGMIISTCEVQFFWNNVTSTSAKSRNLAPRVLSAALKYNPEKEWLGNAFLRESGSDQELASSWMLGTLDVSTLDPVPIIFTIEDTPFSLGNESLLQGPEAVSELNNRVRPSDSWIMLTDGIIYHLLRKNPIGICAMDPQISEFLSNVASSSKFPAAVRANEEKLHDLGTLYDLHLDVFQSFCKSAKEMWCSYGALRDKKNQFRGKLISNQSAVFRSFLEAYKINFRRACGDIDQTNHKWHLFAELFLRQAGVNATGRRSYHEIDDTIKSFDQRLTGLTTMFRFMYQCMDAFLFYCGDMAIGETNLFFDAMQLLFRQVNSAEYPQAIKRLKDERTLDQRSGVRNVNEELRRGFCTASMGFVDSVQLFFARQKYPSLLHWFAQTSDTYQTFKGGWHASPLRTLLVNILDPDGPLGIHSYYPDEASNTVDVDVKAVRREAFYLSCGLFDCRCTTSFEHSRATSSCSRLHQLRHFVLDEFMRETFDFALKEGVAPLLETIVPLFQFVRAVLNHANLNLNVPCATQVGAHNVANNEDSWSSQDFQLCELHPCLEWMVECLIKLVPGEVVVSSTISCVLLTELCGVVCEAISFNEHRPMLELIDLVELVLVYLQTVYVALSGRTTTVMGRLFATCIEYPPSIKLSQYRFAPSRFRGIVVERGQSIPSESYEISLARAVTDLLAGIGRVAQLCQGSSDDRLRYFTAIAS